MHQKYTYKNKCSKATTSIENMKIRRKQYTIQFASERRLSRPYGVLVPKKPGIMQHLRVLLRVAFLHQQIDDQY